jgi:hypothetical protein
MRMRGRLPPREAFSRGRLPSEKTRRATGLPTITFRGVFLAFYILQGMRGTSALRRCDDYVSQLVTH